MPVRRPTCAPAPWTSGGVRRCRTSVTFPPSTWRRERLDELRLATIEARLSAELEMGGHGMVVGSLQRLVDEHPYRERLRGLLMVALYRSGRQVEARRAYRAGYRALAEIGVRPGHELRTLEAGDQS